MSEALLRLAAHWSLDRLLYRVWRYNPRGLYRLYQHHRFDRALNVDTRGYGDLRYEPTPAAAFTRILEFLDIDFARYTFIDIGSGKGKALLLASAFPFRRMIGVERFPEFHRIAERNVAGFPRVELVCCDAVDYTFPEEPSVVYLFNPFGEDLLERIVKNLECSLAKAPRSLFVVYYAPILRRGSPWDRRRVFDSSPALRIRTDNRAFTVYQSSE
ncbi:MAG TPA: class I SAM-dependent methyltransferase [Vicinamibacteria bacterium]|nr:class I SAM-dependent methyltransferase [Vicinamibacteria bacterium]